MPTARIGLRNLVGTGSLVRSSLALVSGTVASQALIFILSPALSRIFGPREFGDLANYNAWVSVLGLLSNMRYEQAILVERHRTGMNRVLALAFALSGASFMLFLLAATTIWMADTAQGYLSEIRHIVLFMPFGILPNVLISALSLFHTRRGKFRLLAWIAFFQAGVTTALQIALGVAGLQNGLIVGALAGAGVTAMAFAFVHARGHPTRRLVREFNWPHLKHVATTHFHFPRYSLPADVFNVVVQQFVPVFLTAMFNPAVAGLYAFSTRVVRVPVFVISTAISTVLRKHAADRVNSRASLKPIFDRATMALLAAGILPFGILALYATPIFRLVWGDKWIDAGTIVRILSPGIYLEFVALPLAVFFIVTRQLRFTFRLQLANLVLLGLALVIGRYQWNDFVLTCVLMSGALVLVNAAAILLARRAASSRPSADQSLAPMEAV